MLIPIPACPVMRENTEALSTIPRAVRLFMADGKTLVLKFSCNYTFPTPQQVIALSVDAFIEDKESRTTFAVTTEEN